MAQDLKIPYLKSLQGYLWLRGYESGEIRCPLFPDVAPSMLRWRDAGVKIIIYSSGSVAAQKLLFQYTNADFQGGDLRSLIVEGEGYFDTVNAGMKQERSSYEKIAATRRESVRKWLFLSDNVKEVKAAKEAGMRSFVVVREGNAPLSEEQKGANVLVESFEKIRITGV